LSSVGVTREELASALYDSLHQQLMPLPDATRVYPAHGAGSACGKNLSTDLWSTMGDQKQSNYALRAPDKATFIELVTEGQPPAPGYFSYDANLNRSDHGLLDESQMPTAMSYDEVLAAIEAGAMLVDGRNPEEFAQGHMRAAINVGLDGRYAEFAGSVVPHDVDIVLVTDQGQELEGKNRLARIGFDRVIGYLDQPYKVMFQHRDHAQVGSRLTATVFNDRVSATPDLQIVDVRNPGEVADGTIPGAIPIPVGQLPDRVGELDVTRPTVVYCAGGYRSSVAASVLRQRGFVDVSDIIGGYGAWINTVQSA
jgi:rhodanese-related sulfurtransferase